MGRSDDEKSRETAVVDGMVRLSLGLEDLADIEADLARALKAVWGERYRLLSRSVT